MERLGQDMQENKSMIKMAIAYDFDGTLAMGNIQENSFLPELGIDKNDFWQQVKKEAEDQNMSEILAYMRLIIRKADDTNTKITYDILKGHGKNVKFFKGVEEYFDRIKKYAKAQGVELEHYIISSGTREMIEGTKIADKFKAIFASSFIFDQYGKPTWPAVAIDYTSKTQYLYRISKGILNAWDSQINKTMPNEQRNIRFENMIYIGDGETDIPAMALLKSKKGISIVVYDDENPDKIKQSKEMLKNDKASYAVPLDYTEESPLDNVIKMAIKKAVLEAKYGKYQDACESNKEELAIAEIENKQEIVPCFYSPTNENQGQNSKAEFESEEYCLKVLGVQGFTTDPNATQYIYLERDRWDDGGYETTFRMYKKTDKNDLDMIGKIKIGFIDQQKDEHTIMFLEKYFTSLRETKFLSYFKITKLDITKDKQKALSFLLNDIRDNDEYDKYDIVKNSLKRGMPFK